MSLKKKIPKVTLDGRRTKPRLLAKKNLNFFLNKERYQKVQEKIFKYRREKYRTQHNMDLVNIKVCKRTFSLYLD
jgi:hypothetical protein